MLDGNETTALLGLFPFLAGAEPPALAQLRARGRRVTLPPDHGVCAEGTACTHLPMVLAGTARVYKLGESGREITLYRIDAGQSCVLTASCILSGRRFPAFARSETAVEAVLVPAPALLEWFGTDAAWRTYLVGLVADRLADVISIVEEVAFRRMDHRVGEHLLRAGDEAGTVRLTHQQVAHDLGTSREVVTRILSDFEARGLVALGRGRIELRDRAGLAAVAGAA